jgi:pentatricopeptide repeat protein
MLNSSMPHDKYTCCLLLKCAFKERDLVRARYIINYCKVNMIEFDRILCLTIVDGFVRNKLFIPAMKMFREMIIIHQPRFIEYNLLLKILTLNPDYKSTTEILSIWKQMHVFGYNIVSYSTIIDYFSKVGDVQAVEKIFEYVALRGISDYKQVISLESNLSDILQKNFDEKNVSKNRKYTNLTGGDNKCNYTDADIVHHLKLPPKKLKNVNLYFWNILMKTYFRQKFHKNGLLIYSYICIYSKPDIVSLTILLEHYAQMNDKHGFLNTLTKIQKDGYSVHDYTLSCIIGFHTRNKDIEAVRNISHMFMELAISQPHLCPDIRIALRVTLSAFASLRNYSSVSEYFENYTKNTRPCFRSSMLYMEALIYERRKPELLDYIQKIVDEYGTGITGENSSDYYNRVILIVVKILNEPVIFKCMMESLIKKGFVPKKETFCYYEKIVCQK